MTAGTPHRSRPALAIGIVLLAAFLFAISDVLAKDLLSRYPVAVVQMLRYLASLSLLAVFVYPIQRGRLWRTQRTGLVLLRGLVLTSASLTMGLALQRMPVGETIAILYLSPFVVMALAVPIFGEKVSPLGWFLAVLGFTGALLIIRPGGALEPTGVFFALLNAGCATVFHLMTRGLARTEYPLALLFWVTLTGAVSFVLMALPDLPAITIPRWDLMSAAMLGVLATSGHFLLSLAYREAPASTVAPANYFHLVWAALLGLVVFNHLPDPITMTGMLLIFASGIGLALTSHMNMKRLTKI